MQYPSYTFHSSRCLHCINVPNLLRIFQEVETRQFPITLLSLLKLLLTLYVIAPCVTAFIFLVFAEMRKVLF